MNDVRGGFRVVRVGVFLDEHLAELVERFREVSIKKLNDGDYSLSLFEWPTRLAESVTCKKEGRPSDNRGRERDILAME